MIDQQTLRETIADALRETIVNGELKPGIRTNEINRIKEKRR